MFIVLSDFLLTKSADISYFMYPVSTKNSLAFLSGHF